MIILQAQYFLPMTRHRYKSFWLKTPPRYKNHTHVRKVGTHFRISFLAFIDELWKTRKIRLLTTWKELLEISSFYKCVPKTTIIWGTVPEIRSETEFFVILGHFLPSFPLTTQKTKILKKWKKHLEISSL